MRGCSFLTALMTIIGGLAGLLFLQETPATESLPQAEPAISAVMSVPDPRLAETAPVSQLDFNQFAWDMFLYLNQPVIPGEDTAMWETWKSTYEVYLPCGVTPAPWGESAEIPSSVIDAVGAEEAATLKFLPATSKFLQNDINIDGSVLTDTDGNPIRYEVRMNESTFNTIVSYGYYNRDTQIGFFNDSFAPALQFWQDALEVKASWRQIDPSDPEASRYHLANGYYFDENDNPVFITVGMTGLHITSKYIPNWVWMTFEQVDNQVQTNAPLVDPIPPDVEAVNNAYHSQLPSDSIWQYYNLRGAQVSFTTGSYGELLANTQIETGFQETSSCITCHALATIGSEADGRLFFFDFTDGNFEGYLGDLSDLTFYTAEDEPLTYDAAFSGFRDEEGTLRYKQLDFVWSLREAQATCTN